MVKRYIKKISTVLYLIFILACVLFCGSAFVIKATGGVPNVFGYSVMVVVSPSMTPTIAVGDVIISKISDDTTTYEVGDIISYHGEEGELEGKLITHRIISLSGTNEELKLVTQGDANSVSDPEISKSQIVSKFVRKSGVVTFLYSFFSSVGGFILIISLLGLVIVWEGKNFVITLKKGEKEDEENSDEK